MKHSVVQVASDLLEDMGRMLSLHLPKFDYHRSLVYCNHYLTVIHSDIAPSAGKFPIFLSLSTK